MDIKEFVDKGNIIAVVGASADEGKWGYKLLAKLKSLGFVAYPVNPKHSQVKKWPCYPTLAAVPRKPDVVITVVPPGVTGRVVREVKQHGIGKVWMQPGSESPDAIAYCRENRIEVVHNKCFVVDGLKTRW